jgi:hypothetical protein
MYDLCPRCCKNVDINWHQESEVINNHPFADGERGCLKCGYIEYHYLGKLYKYVFSIALEDGEYLVKVDIDHEYSTIYRRGTDPMMVYTGQMIIDRTVDESAIRKFVKRA